MRTAGAREKAWVSALAAWDGNGCRLILRPREGAWFPLCFGANTVCPCIVPVRLDVHGGEAGRRDGAGAHVCSKVFKGVRGVKGVKGRVRVFERGGKKEDSDYVGAGEGVCGAGVLSEMAALGGQGRGVFFTKRSERGNSLVKDDKAV